MRHAVPFTARDTQDGRGSPEALKADRERPPETIEFPRSPDTAESLLRERQFRQLRREEPLDHIGPIDGLNYMSLNLTDRQRDVLLGTLVLMTRFGATTPEEQLTVMCEQWRLHCPRAPRRREYPDHTKHLPEIWR